jgi:hypothetical protein
MFTGTKATSFDTDYVIDATDANIQLKAAKLFVPDAVLGDNLKFQIVDVDGVAYPAGTIIAEYVRSWCIFPNVANEVEDVSISSPIPQGFYIRLKYNSDASATVDPKGVINLIGYLDL